MAKYKLFLVIQIKAKHMAFLVIKIAKKSVYINIKIIQTQTKLQQIQKTTSTTQIPTIRNP